MIHWQRAVNRSQSFSLTNMFVRNTKNDSNHQSIFTREKINSRKSIKFP